MSAKKVNTAVAAPKKAAGKATTSEGKSKSPQKPESYIHKTANQLTYLYTEENKRNIDAENSIHRMNGVLTYPEWLATKSIKESGKEAFVDVKKETTDRICEILGIVSKNAYNLPSKMKNAFAIAKESKNPTAEMLKLTEEQYQAISDEGGFSWLETVMLVVKTRHQKVLTLKGIDTFQLEENNFIQIILANNIHKVEYTTTAEGTKIPQRIRRAEDMHMLTYLAKLSQMYFKIMCYEFYLYALYNRKSVDFNALSYILHTAETPINIMSGILKTHNALVEKRRVEAEKKKNSEKSTKRAANTKNAEDVVVEGSDGEGEDEHAEPANEIDEAIEDIVSDATNITPP